MAGRGPAPKDPVRRARRNAEPSPQTVLRFEQAEPPDLPWWPGEEGDWPERTRDWWQMWRASPQAEHFSSTDWDFLLDTALIHARLWSGEASAAAELRLRVAKFGATPEDRSRLRMQFAQADEADAQRPHREAAARDRYATLRVIKPAGAAET
ncbi:hypothetical protein [Streptomyces mesophilus]|uniref:phage terminase small subunit n=1 Tax=Streptomyces mesophilus TaxID=1775132 RepID=UPI003317BB80